MTTLSAKQIAKWRDVFADGLTSSVPELRQAAQEKLALCDMAKRALPGEGDTPRVDALAKGKAITWMDYADMTALARQLEREARGRWVPVSERLPDEDMPVLMNFI